MHSTFLRENAFAELQDELKLGGKARGRNHIFWGARLRRTRSHWRILTRAIAINHRIGADHDLRGRAESSSITQRAPTLSSLLRTRQVVWKGNSLPWSDRATGSIAASTVWRHRSFCAIPMPWRGWPRSLPNSYLILRLVRRLLPIPYEPGAYASNACSVWGRSDTPDRKGRRACGIDAASRAKRLIRRSWWAATAWVLAAEARTIIPMMAAGKRSVEGIICYSKPSGPVTRQDAK